MVLNLGQLCPPRGIQGMLLVSGGYRPRMWLMPHYEKLIVLRLEKNPFKAWDHLLKGLKAGVRNNKWVERCRGRVVRMRPQR